ncbi:RNA-binding domain-containing protein [Annulohypoxylon maeteangense]|uniref:RNA-binding domain-containing protein n=1 Tax=Annulohypoxylon maeteangense TaxID=1927788 RepID=UPI00200797D4|nr:RNA-binding domain-containing protein [Annulohypoxylon maeteangense]KAI0889127.1 RNA-binding domain-containing protein [Annulohypoxylon maeteangense]
MDRSLDEIVAESQHKKRGSRPRRGGGGNGGGGGGGRPRERDTYPRDGVRKSTRDDSRNMDSEWVHDKFDEPGSRNRQRNPRRRPSPDRFQETRGVKVKVDNLHYELTEEDLDGLFAKIGNVVKLELLYDRAGRSEGTAFVTYENRNDAMEAIKQYDGANAKGQPIRLSTVSSAPRRNPFDTAHMPGRPLAERITRPRSLSPRRNSDRDRGVDRYVPGRVSRSRSPLPRRRGNGGGGGNGGGRRPGARREAGTSTPNGRERTGRDGRPKKTQEELDAEMADYFNPSGSNDAAPAAQTSANAPVGDDVDMIE